MTPIQSLKINGRAATMFERADHAGKSQYAITFDRDGNTVEPPQGLTGWTYTKKAARENASAERA